MRPKAEFKIEFEDGSSATLCLADPRTVAFGEIGNVRGSKSWSRALVTADVPFGE
jgi:hypothetical protein